MFNPTNQRNSKLYSNCSISSRSLRTLYSACNSSARNSLSGAIDGRPIHAYNASNLGDIRCNAASVITRTRRSG